MTNLKFQKMWEAADTYVFDIDTGSIIPIVDTLGKVSSFADRYWFYFYEKGIGSAYYEEGEMTKAAEAGLKDFSDPAYEKKYFSRIQSLLEYQSGFYQKIEETDFSKISSQILKGLFQESVDLIVKNFGYYLACQPQCVSLIEKRVQEKLSKIVSKDKINEAFTLLSTPTIATKIRREERDWLNRLLISKKEKLSEGDGFKIIETHYKEYYLLNAADGHEPWNFEYFLKKFKEDCRLSIGEIKNKLSSLDSSLKDMKKSKVEFIKKNKIPADITKDSNLLAEIGHWRLEMRFVWMPGYYYDKFILCEIAKRFSCDSHLIRFSTVAEILKLFDGIPPDREELEKRSEAFMFVIEDGNAYVLSGKKAKKKFSELVQVVDYKDVKEFGGNVAMKGNVIGRAVVFKWTDSVSEKMKSMDDDSILVAGQTRPQLMPLIAKSKAIITDEGGITSHAAIVSRELGIPCIIGTKIATSVIKDGDIVEVDADKGIVRILN